MIKPRITSFQNALEHASASESGYFFYDKRLNLKSSLPYSELYHLAKIGSLKLRKLGIAYGDAVGLIATTDPMFIVGFYSCMLAGAVPVPIPPPAAFGKHELYFEHIHKKFTLANVKNILVSVESKVIFDSLNHKLSGIIWHSFDVHFENNISDFFSFPKINIHDTAYIQFSSGTTGSPKAIRITFEKMIANCEAINHYGLLINSNDRAVSWLPMYHDMGLVGFMIAPLFSQTSVNFLSTTDFVKRPLSWLELISKTQSTISYSPSFGYELCIRSMSSKFSRKEIKNLDLRTWRVAGIGAELISVSVLRTFFNTFASSGFREDAFAASYGLAESVLAVTISLGGLKVAKKPSKQATFDQESEGYSDLNLKQEFAVCGHAFPDHNITIRDFQGTILPASSIGSVCISGPSVSIENPNINQKSNDVAWLDTGDLGFMSDEGLVVVGRSKEIIIVNGRKFFPDAIESVLFGLDDIRIGDVVAFSSFSEQGEGMPTVIIQKLIKSTSLETLTQKAQSIVFEKIGIRVQIWFVPPHTLPKTTSGKIARNIAKKMFADGKFSIVSF